MKYPRFLVATLALGTACTSFDDVGEGPPSLTELEPAGGSAGASSVETAGASGSGGSTSGDEPVPCGGDGLACCGAGCEDELVCLDGMCGEATSGPAPEPPAAACGSNGQACCATGVACSGGGGKAQCCTACGGAPDFNCQCDAGLVPEGTCHVCCVACNDGHEKPGPQLVAGNQSCQEAAQKWCQANRNVGAAQKSGWRDSCQW